MRAHCPATAPARASPSPPPEHHLLHHYHHYHTLPPPPPPPRVSLPLSPLPLTLSFLFLYLSFLISRELQGRISSSSSSSLSLIPVSIPHHGTFFSPSSLGVILFPRLLLFRLSLLLLSSVLLLSFVPLFSRKPRCCYSLRPRIVLRSARSILIASATNARSFSLLSSLSFLFLSSYDRGIGANDQRLLTGGKKRTIGDKGREGRERERARKHLRTREDESLGEIASCVRVKIPSPFLLCHYHHRRHQLHLLALRTRAPPFSGTLFDVSFTPTGIRARQRDWILLLLLRMRRVSLIVLGLRLLVSFGCVFSFPFFPSLEIESCRG